MVVLHKSETAKRCHAIAWDASPRWRMKYSDSSREATAGSDTALSNTCRRFAARWLVRQRTWDLRPRLFHVVALRLKLCIKTRAYAQGHLLLEQLIATTTSGSGWCCPAVQRGRLSGLLELARHEFTLPLGESSLSEERANPVCQLRMYIHATKVLSGRSNVRLSQRESDSIQGDVKGVASQRRRAC
jgi:hypothetical protein